MIKYVHEKSVHNTKAAEVIVPIVMRLAHPKSVLDIGCGIGTWLKIFNEAGVGDFFGVDGEDLAQDALQISETNFSVCDLTRPLDLEKEFDLVVSLEVAEHLPEFAAEQFVATLIKHSKLVLFSAAIPGQGGQNHLNEQWPDYWQEKFWKHKYKYYDLIRPEVWNDERVDVWYRQNMFLVCHENINLQALEYSNSNLIHPEFWMRKIETEKIMKKRLENWRNGNAGVINTGKALVKSLKKLLQT